MINKSLRTIFKIFCFLILLSNVDVIKAGEIKGTVIIKRPQSIASKIVSRSIIQRYVTKGSYYHAHSNRETDEPTVVVYISGLKKIDTKDNRIAVLDQQSEAFVPHVLPILVKSTVQFLNSDEVYHNVFSYSKAKSFDLGRYAKGKYRSVNFNRPGVVKVYCDIHTNMNAFILVLENPYFTTTDENGKFEIKNVPSGDYTLKAWYGRWPEKSKNITVKSSEVTEVNFTFP